MLASTRAGRSRMRRRPLPPTVRPRLPLPPRGPGSPPPGSSSTCSTPRSRRRNAAVAAAKADVDTAELDLGFTEIRSPIDGIVGNRLAQVGTYVSPGSYLLTIVPASGLWVDANFKEDQLRNMSRRPGGNGLHRHCARRAAQGPRHQPGAGDRGDLQRHPAAERHRQFHQDRPACSRPDHDRPGSGRRRSRCGQACRPTVTVDTASH